MPFTAAIARSLHNVFHLLLHCGDCVNFGVRAPVKAAQSYNLFKLMGRACVFSLTLFRCLVFLMCCNPNELKVFTVHVTEIQGKCTIQNLVLVELWLR